MDRYWLLTNTLYGTWLPGSARGFVGQVREHRAEDSADSERITHNIPGTPCDEDMPGLEQAARERMKGPPLSLTTAHADALFEQFQETARHRGWELRAVSIMHNHFHIVVGVPGDPSPSKILGDFKSWGTRKLSDVFGTPASETWWTERGSKRKLKDERALAAAIHYVLYEQPNPLLTWSPETGLHHGPPPPKASSRRKPDVSVSHVYGRQAVADCGMPPRRAYASTLASAQQEPRSADRGSLLTIPFVTSLRHGHAPGTGRPLPPDGS